MFLKFYFFPGCVSSYFKFCLFFLFCGLFRFFCFLALAFISFDNKLLNIYYRILLIPAIMRCNVSPTDRETEVSEQINKCRNETSAARKKKVPPPKQSWVFLFGSLAVRLASGSTILQIFLWKFLKYFIFFLFWGSYWVLTRNFP